MHPPFPDALPGAAVRVASLGVIAARGPDAVSFLQGQLTNDLTRLTASEARLAGFCSAKGRLQASFLVWLGGADEVFLACAASVLPATLKRLSMFVLRAKCKLFDATVEVPLWGRLGANDALAVWQRDGDADLLQIRLPDANGQRRTLTRQPPSPAAAELPLDVWRWLDIESGVPTIEAATADRFVPQMLNYELLGGVDFRKGCYPGQEVVARSQYRGTLKRRMFLFDVAEAAAPGDEIFDEADPGQPAGMVVNSAPRPGGRAFSVLAEVKLAALAHRTLHLRDVGGPPLTHRELPYTVPLDGLEAA